MVRSTIRAGTALARHASRKLGCLCALHVHPNRPVRRPGRAEVAEEPTVPVPGPGEVRIKMLATVGALVVGKAVLVANAMPFLRRYDRAPLIQPILFKTVVYWAVVFVARILEEFAHFCLVEHHWVGDFLPHMVAIFSWHRFAAIQLWILVLFLIYVTASELNHLFGDGELRRIFFTHRPSELQLNRRQRIRELVRLSRLADAHSVDEFRDPTSAAHRQLIDIVRRLAR